ncbi:hypothetical protein [Paludisphaera mucosa]|uniref:Secreted protein n=1 Tax=Paludisphaera mucosa TaxID=3030827 RepID=A0ABT6F3V4_9BACT|nr:hypothetical protein [Paludisphaera mucosa]MDG3002268.1 hypothetical protein [Paludisphaera mucosa]
MRRTTALICLLAVLTGTPLRQAEASADWSRSQQAEALQPTDGGVGDDAGFATPSATHPGAAGDFRDAGLAFPQPVACVPAPVDGGSLGTGAGRPAPFPGRLARLQVLRI